MKLLVLGHAFMLAYIQKKYVAMKQFDPGLQLRLVVPTRMQDRFHFRAYEVHSALSPGEVVPLKARLAGWQAHMTYVHGPGRLAGLLSDFQPDVIHIEEEPQALLSVETIFLQRLFAPKASVTLFTWDNILRERSFPVGIAKGKLRRYSLSRTTAVVCGNQRSAELLRSEGYFRGGIENLPQSGLDVLEHEPGNELKLRVELGLEGGIVVGHVGRLVPEKGLALLVEALRRLDGRVSGAHRPCSSGDLRGGSEISSLRRHFHFGILFDSDLERTIRYHLGAGNAARYRVHRFYLWRHSGSAWSWRNTFRRRPE
jgi:glycosyltransferase involved in cell wall biosynthesis